MAEEIQTNVTTGKAFKVSKAVPTRVIFSISPLSNPGIRRTIELTRLRPSVILPIDYALGLFMDEGPMSLLRKGIITVSNLQQLVHIALEQGVLFDEIELPTVSERDPQDILAILKGGKRLEIENAIKKYGDDKVKDVAFTNKDELTQNVIQFLETKWKVQLTMDGSQY